MIHKITKEQYINDPCGTSSVSYWKNSRYKKPDDIHVVHRRDIASFDQNECHITRYFRIIHNLSKINIGILNDEYYFSNVNVETQNEAVAKLINLCYEDIEVTLEQVKEWSSCEVFDNELWVFINEKATSSPVALGIADYNSQIKEGSLEWIQVLPEKQGHGLGEAIVNELLLRLSKKADFATVSGQLENGTNPESLYRKCGFTGDDVWWFIAETNSIILASKESPDVV
jgi:ribosomal protein S18 acetylase RimI-like enzyme